MAVHLAGGTHLRQHRRRDPEEIQQLGIPLQRVDIEQHGARCIGDIGHMHLPAGEVPHQPAVHGTEPQVSRIGHGTRSGNVLQDPPDLGRAEIRIDDQPGLFPDAGGEALRFQAVAIIGRPPVLPNDGMADGLARAGVPDNGGFPLVGDADTGHLFTGKPGHGHGFRHHGRLGSPDLTGVMLHPARSREMLGKLLLRHAEHIAGMVKNDGPGRAGPLVQGKDTFFHITQVHKAGLHWYSRSLSR